MAFAVHGTSELSFTGGAAALLLGVSVEHRGAGRGGGGRHWCSGCSGCAQRERDSVIGVVLAFGLGLGVLLLCALPGAGGRTSSACSPARSSAWTRPASRVLGGGAPSLVLVILAVIYRPLLFASVDPEVARGARVPVRLLSPVFAVLVGVPRRSACRSSARCWCSR